MDTLSPDQISEVLEFDTKNREINARGNPSTRSKTYNLIVPHYDTSDQKLRDVTIARVAVKRTKSGESLVKVVSFADLETVTTEGNLTIHYRDMGFHMIAGWIVYWDSDEFERRNQFAWYCSAKFGEWSEEAYRFRCGLSAPYDPTVNPSALADTRYKYCAYRGNKIGLIDHLLLYRRDPKVELLSKSNLDALINPAGLRALKSKEMIAYIRDHLAEVQRASETCNVKEILYSIRNGVSPKDAIAHFQFVAEMRTFLPKRVSWCYNTDEARRNAYKLDYERLRRDLPKWGVEKSEYARYLYQVIDAGLDLKCEGVLYPPIRDGRASFMARLEKLELENARRRAREERDRRAKARAEEAARLAKEQAVLKKTLASRLKELTGFQKSVDRVMKISLRGCTCIVAKSQEELRREGKRMGNCVGCGTYGRGVVFGNTIILQFKDKRGHSWCDAEIDRSNWKVRQCYARRNEVAPEAVKSAADEIAKLLKAKHRENRRAHAFPLLERSVA